MNQFSDYQKKFSNEQIGNLPQTKTKRFRKD